MQTIRTVNSILKVVFMQSNLSFIKRMSSYPDASNGTLVVVFWNAVAIDRSNAHKTNVLYRENFTDIEFATCETQPECRATSVSKPTAQFVSCRRFPPRC